VGDSDDRKRRRTESRRRASDRVDLGEPYLPDSQHSAEEPLRGAIALTLPTNWEYLRPWLHRYTASHSILGVANLVFKSRQTAAFAAGMEYAAAMEGAYDGDTPLPLVQFTILADRASCRLTAWCNEARFEVDFRTLLQALAGQWPTVAKPISEYLSMQAAPEPLRPDRTVAGGKFGADRDLTFDEVLDIVTRCRAFQQRGGKVPDFYDMQNLQASTRGYYSLETLRAWLKNPKFKR
jgi:hypothetical protein